MRAVGENPQSADVSGIHVNKRRRQAIYLCGSTPASAVASSCSAQVGTLRASRASAGRGFIAIAAVIFGGWTLKGTIAGCSCSASSQALGSVLQALGYGPTRSCSTSLPYVLALATMLLFATARRQPAALARPFVRGLT